MFAAALSEASSAAEPESIPEQLRTAISRQNAALDKVLALAEQWWTGGPCWRDDGSHMRDYGYSADAEKVLDGVLVEIAEAYEKAHGEQWDGRTDPQIGGIKWWCSPTDPFLAPTDGTPYQAIWFDKVEWRWYPENQPCGGLRCTIAEMSDAETDEWAGQIIAVIRGDKTLATHT
jgi:hypothetical protein